MSKIIEIERYGPSSMFWPNLIKGKHENESAVKNILDKYQGFEGELIELYPLLPRAVSLCKNILLKLVA